MYSLVKRIIDIVIALFGLVVLGPAVLLLGLLIRVDSPGPALYRGVRVGMGGRPFKMLKFRTMVVDADKMGASSTGADDRRITRLGHFLRRYKLDELPQLINVLKGDMSLVGPRPQVQWAVDLYSAEERRILNVRPGITDPASLRFSNEGELLRGSADPDKDYMQKIHPEKMRLSLEYVRTRSLWVDLNILLQTVAAVVKR